MRAVVLKDGLPYRALGPGRHFLWGLNLSVITYDLRDHVLSAPPEIRAVLPADWYDEVVVSGHERAVIRLDGLPVKFLRPGTHRFWTIDPGLALEVFSVDRPMPELTDELAAVIPSREYVDTVVRSYEKALHYVEGRLVGVLEPGRYALWSTKASPVEVKSVDMRQCELQLAGQELMTRDKVTLRLSLAVEYRVADPVKAVEAVANVRDAVYLMVQLAARDYVSGVTLDALLEGRDEMTQYLSERCVTAASEIGLRLARVGVKDVVLPGEMKVLLNRVIEAEKEAAANVILRREETAATRSLANTAKMMAASPVLLRLKELESLKEIAGQIGEVRLVVGSDGLDKLALGGLLPRGEQ